MNGIIAAMVFGWVYMALALVWRYRGERPMESLVVALRMMSPEQRRNVLAPYVSASEAAKPRRVSAGVGRQGMCDGAARDDNEEC